MIVFSMCATGARFLKSIIYHSKKVYFFLGYIYLLIMCENLVCMYIVIFVKLILFTYILLHHQAMYFYILVVKARDTFTACYLGSHQHRQILKTLYIVKVFWNKIKQWVQLSNMHICVDYQLSKIRHYLVLSFIQMERLPLSVDLALRLALLMEWFGGHACPP